MLAILNQYKVVFVVKSNAFMQAVTRSFLQYWPFIKRKKPKEILVANEADLFPRIHEPFTITPFHGYECADFTHNKRNCKLVKPKVPAAGHPWIWRSRFWDHQPQVDIGLLEIGFHVAYCDVVEMFGNTRSIEIWNDFYAYMQTLGLSQKVALHAMSRGSFYVYNWALANGNKVSCIYADNPILDIKSWPWNLGRGIGSKKDRRIFRNAFNFKTHEDVMQFRGNPLDRAAEIAALGFPILHVCGEEDEFVPIEENTDLFEKIIKKEGGDITVIRKPGVRHHPHGLQDPSPIINFVVKATKRQ